MKLLQHTVQLQQRLGPFTLIPFSCFSMDTEVLTKQGWVSRNDLSVGHEILTFNLATNGLEWNAIRQMVDHPAGAYPELLVSPSHHFAVTPDHGIWYSQTYRKSRPGWRRRPAEEFRHPMSGQNKIPVSGEYEGKGLSFSNLLLQLFGWFIAEGSFVWDSRYVGPQVPGVHITQRQSNAWRITSLLDSVGISYKVYTYDHSGESRMIRALGRSACAREPLSHIVLQDKAFRRQLVEIFPGKIIPWWFLGMTKEQFSFFLDGLVQGDGTWHDLGRRGVLHQAVKARLDVVQALCTLHGFCTRLRRSRNEPELWSLSFRRTTTRSFGEPLRTIPYADSVWCVVVDNESVVCRREGRVVILSNCVHADDPGFNENLFAQCIDEIRRTPDCRAVGLGDYKNFLRTTARKHLRSYIADEDSWLDLDRMVREEAQVFVKKWLMPIREKLIGLSEGNHLYEFSSGGTDTQYMCQMLGVPYLDKPAFLRLHLRYGQRTMKTLRVLIHHGDWSSGYQRPGGDVNAMELKALGFDMDVYLFAHTHRLHGIHIPTVTVSTEGELRVIERPRAFIRTGCFMRGYVENCTGRYVDKKLLNPTAMGYARLLVKFEQKYDAERYAKARKTRPVRSARNKSHGNVSYKFEVHY